MKPEGNTLHLRCGLKTFKFVCPKMSWDKCEDGHYRRICHCENPCTNSACGRMVYLYPEKDLRRCPGTVRGTEVGLSNLFWFGIANSQSEFRNYLVFLTVSIPVIVEDPYLTIIQAFLAVYPHGLAVDELRFHTVTGDRDAEIGKRGYLITDLNDIVSIGIKILAGTGGCLEMELFDLPAERQDLRGRFLK